MIFSVFQLERLSLENERKGITIKSIIHGTISLILSIILFGLQFPIESCVFCFLSGVFLDIDHLLDFLLWSEDKDFRKFSILGPPYFTQTHYLDTVFHSIDLFSLLVIPLAFSFPTIIVGVIVGFSNHLLLDYLGNGFSFLHYFLLYRVLFEKRKERDLRDAIYQKDGFRCVDCGVTHKLQIHRAIIQGSWVNITEWVTLCEDCHIKRHGSGQFY